MAKKVKKIYRQEWTAVSPSEVYVPVDNGNEELQGMPIEDVGGGNKKYFGRIYQASSSNVSVSFENGDLTGITLTAHNGGFSINSSNGDFVTDKFRVSATLAFFNGSVPPIISIDKTGNPSLLEFYAYAPDGSFANSYAVWVEIEILD